MYRMLIASALGLIAAGAGVSRLATLERQLDEFERLKRETPTRIQGLDRDLESLGRELARLAGEVEAVGEAKGRTEEQLQLRLNELWCRLEEARLGLEERLVSQETEFSELEELARSCRQDLQALRAEEGSLEQDERLLGLAALAESALAVAQEASARVEDLARTGIGRDSGAMWRELVGPTVQLSGRSTVGSGVLLRPRRGAEGKGWEFPILTAWHVVRDIRAEAGGEEARIPIAIYLPNGVVRREEARVVRENVALDVALLRMHCEESLAPGAWLAPRSVLESIQVFDEIYAVGCPLGNDPIPTRGEVSDVRHQVDGKGYWMISAPTYIGNSGGPIFDAETHQLIGVFTKIYTHGNLRPTIVPHMGLMTPLSQIYDWLEAEGLASLVPEEADESRGWSLALR